MSLKIFPFANLELGQCFMYDCAPYMKIGALSCRGTYTNYTVNAVGLLSGYLVKFNNQDTVRLIDNQWKEVNYEETETQIEE